MIHLLVAFMSRARSIELEQGPTPVPFLDLEKFAGRWYEQAHVPNPYEKNCVNSMAEFTLEHRRVKTNFSCHNIDNNRVEEMVAHGYPTDSSNAVWHIKKDGIVGGDYIISWIDADYKYAVTTDPHYKMVQIYAREKVMPESVYNTIVETLKGAGYPVEKFIRSKTN